MCWPDAHDEVLRQCGLPGDAVRLNVTTLTRIAVRVPSTSTESVEDCLLAHGAVSVTLLAGSSEELFAEHGLDAPLWTQCRVEGLFESADVWPEVCSALRTCCPEAEIESQEALTDQDWESQFRQFAVDETFSGKLRLAPRGAQVLNEAIVTVQLDPGMAFGTGSHPTTRLCLDWIAAADVSGRRALDFGCGSGVLAIALALLGATSVDAVDIDPQAVLATRDNAAFNGLVVGEEGDDRFSVWQTADFEPRDGGYDIVIANILLNPLIELAPHLIRYLAPGGVLVLSGVLAAQREALISAYPGVSFDEVIIRDEWLRAACRRVA